jgi:hypothetical protein
MTSMGLSMGGVIISPITALAINTLGFSRATPLLGLIFFTVVTLVVTLVMPPSPPEVALRATATASATAAAPAPPAHADDAQEADAEVALEEAHQEPAPDIPYRESLHTKAFWVLVASQALMLGGHIAAITHVVRLGTERGVGIAGLLVSVLTVAAVGARFLGAPALRVFTLWPWTAMVFAIQAFAVTTLAFASSTATIVFGCLVLGFGVGSAPVVLPLTLVETFGMLDYARLAAVQQLVTCIGPGLAPILVSLVHDEYGGYRAGYLAIAAMGWASVVLVYVAGRLARALVRDRQAAHAFGAAGVQPA